MKNIEHIKKGGNVRLTGGIFSGRKISTPGEKTHPMGERERLALFNMLGNLAGMSVLDVFAGSGALGIEAISRGAAHVVFIEKNAAAARVIRENLVALGASGEVIVGDVASAYLAEKFDTILADPPYDNFEIEKILPLVDLLKDGGTLVLSHPGEAPAIERLVLEKTRQYAAAHLSFYRLS